MNLELFLCMRNFFYTLHVRAWILWETNCQTTSHLSAKKMKNIKAIDSFIEQPDGSLKVTDPEGFVIVDHIGRAMKIVDRLEFSAANFAPRD